MATTLATVLQTAAHHHRGGQLATAERLYRQVLERDPSHDVAAYLLGVLTIESGRLEDSVEMFSRAIMIAPDKAAYHANLGEAQRRLGRHGDAVASFFRAVTIQPDLAEAHYNLGLLLQQVGEIDGAIDSLQRAAELKPGLPGVAQRLAAARQDRERTRSSHAASLPASSEMLVELVKSMHSGGRVEGGIALIRRALEVQPRLAAAHCILGNMLTDRDELDEAIASYRSALEIEPDMPEVHNNLGNLLSRCGAHDDAVAAYRKALELRPEATLHHSNFLFNLHFHPRYDARTILEEAIGWDRRHGLPLGREIAPHGNDRTPDRRIRVGYVSPDFRKHCQALFVSPLLGHHDRTAFEIFCYSDVLQPDDVTAGLLRRADQWRSIVAMDDSTVAARIRDDRIDVLVDLTMHMQRSRLPVFARKPAPVQISWLAYPGTTGLSAIDYRLTDRFLDPPGSDTSVYAETSLWLADAFWCYDPMLEEEVSTPPPSRSNGYVRFGCLNNFCKVNDAVIDLWARVLREVDGSKLTLLAPAGESRRGTVARFESRGIPGDRIEFVGPQHRLAYLRTYHGIDVCLDTFPYNGHTTSLDAFWMGVPVVTLVGTTVVGRAGLCQAMNLGLPELVARTPDEYVKAAVGLATDVDRLSELRAGLRKRMERSPLMDAPRFARSIEATYREAWRRWCERSAPG